MAELAGVRRHPELDCTREFSRHQRAWFEEVRQRALDGEPFAVLSADSPHEIYRAMDIPYIVLQWWSSVIAAKQRAPAYLRRLVEAGYPDSSEQYNSLALGELLDDDPCSAPWGGLPRPTIIQASVSSDTMRHLFEVWAARSGARFLALERSIDTRICVPECWWEELPTHWEEFLPRQRLDVLHHELIGLIRTLESTTGRKFRETRFVEALHLANEQAEHNRATRDLIARSHPAPASIAETMPAVMIPQWHRGSAWGRDAARILRQEVEARAARGEAACPQERIRLMWLGRGLWSSMGLYQQFHDRYGAVFVWSMYLGLAADGYARYFDGRDPLRALAARFVPMGDELRMPGWSSAWHLKEARLHGVDGVVSFGEDDHFSVLKLEEAGIPVLSIRGENVDRRTWSEQRLTTAIATFLEERVIPMMSQRRSNAT